MTVRSPALLISINMTKQTPLSPSPTWRTSPLAPLALLTPTQQSGPWKELPSRPLTWFTRPPWHGTPKACGRLAPILSFHKAPLLSTRKGLNLRIPDVSMPLPHNGPPPLHLTGATSRLAKSQTVIHQICSQLWRRGHCRSFAGLPRVRQDSLGLCHQHAKRTAFYLWHRSTEPDISQIPLLTTKRTAYISKTSNLLT